MVSASSAEDGVTTEMRMGQLFTPKRFDVPSLRCVSRLFHVGPKSKERYPHNAARMPRVERKDQPPPGSPGCRWTESTLIELPSTEDMRSKLLSCVYSFIRIYLIYV